MKKINIAYWIVTGLFSAFMISTSVPNVLKNPDSINLISEGLGYPEYMIPFLGIAKITGSITILIPQFKKLKEWAYAGLFFDLAGAWFSIIAKHGFAPDQLFMLVFFGFFFASYYLNIKKEEVKE